MGVQTLTNLTSETECFTIDLIYFTCLSGKGPVDNIWNGEAPSKSNWTNFFFLLLSKSQKFNQISSSVTAQDFDLFEGATLDDIAAPVVFH